MLYFFETIGAFLAIFIVYRLGLSKIAIQIISVGGAIVLFWLASKVWKIDKINTESKQILTFYQIIILTILNSGYWIFWITIGIPKSLMLNDIMIGGQYIFLFIFEIGWLVATTSLAFIFYKFRPILLKRNLVSITFKILACVLIILGFKILLNIF